MAKRKSSTFKRVVIALVAVAVLSGIGLGISFYLRFTSPNVKVPADHESFLYVPTGTTFDQLVEIVREKKIVRRSESFKWVALKLKLDENVPPGRYKIKNGMSNLELVRLLRSGRQTPVNLVLTKYRSKQDLAGAVSRKLEIDSMVFLTALSDDVYLQRFDMTPQQAMALFIPNTYEFYWNTPLDKFFIKMAEQHEKFWSDTRRQKAQNLGLTPIEATVLASIVEEETNINAEKDDIASVYLNRLRKGMLLQADPTVKYAVGNFGLRRVLQVHTSYISPYNTYVTPGLPPGPICTPSPKTIDAVLNAGDTDYLFFCADPDRIGYHLFASNYKEHQLNAERYRQSLNRRGIR
jgi:UPF0755 protein